MTAAVISPATRWPRLDIRIAAALSVAAVIAALQPFDVLFAAATFGQPVLRAGAIVAMALAGGAAAHRVGLQVGPTAGRRSLLVPLLAAVVVALGCAVADRVFKPSLHAPYARLMTSVPLAARMTLYMLRAFNENIIYRLFLGSVLAWALGRVWRRDGAPAEAAIWAAFAVAQAINVWANVTSQAPVTAPAVLHDTLRYFAPGMVWSWLYRRHGFQANEIASTSVHLFFQPLAGILLA